MYNQKIILLLFISVVFITSCNKDVQQKPETQTSKTDVTEENDLDTNMTSEEIFSSSLVQNILGEDDNDDLQIYLEDQIYPIVSACGKVTLDRVSASLYLLSHDEKGTMKNLLIQKFYDPVKDEFVFDKSETSTDARKQFIKQ
ncbi:MAG: hypothetical protein SGI89_15880 [bacterium]|nr:hypothetical protein [bacterium]